MTISIIIPTLNEAENIGALLHHLYENSTAENIADIIIVDGGSSDNTVQIAREQGARVLESGKGRARQMNAGAAVASGDHFYFLHADTLPPENYDACILHAVAEGYCAGSFLHRFDHDHWILRFISHILNTTTRVRFGDQSLFVEHNIFLDVKGFDETNIIMEDSDIVRRISAQYPFTTVDCAVVTSARKFRENGELRLFLIFFLIYTLYEFNVSQRRLLWLYKALIRQNKI